MTQDIDLLRKCADAMGFRHYTSRAGIVFIKDYYPANVQPRDAPWNPLIDATQAWALAQRFMLTVDFFATSAGLEYVKPEDRITVCLDEPAQIKEAICRCVARIYDRKRKAA